MRWLTVWLVPELNGIDEWQGALLQLQGGGEGVRAVVVATVETNGGRCTHFGCCDDDSGIVRANSSHPRKGLAVTGYPLMRSKNLGPNTSSIGASRGWATEYETYPSNSGS